MAPGPDEPTRVAEGDDAPGAAQVRDLLVPYRPPGPAAYRFLTVQECEAQGIEPTDVVHELAERDVLGLKPRVRRLLRERALLLEPERLWMRSLARATYRGTAEGVRRPEPAWLDEIVRDSIRDLLGEDRQEEADMVPLDDLIEDDYAMLTELLGVPPDRARLAAVRFNGLPDERRRIAFRTIVEGWSLDRCVEDGLGDHAYVESELRAALNEVARTDRLPRYDPLSDEDLLP